MKKLLDLNGASAAAIEQATTWSFLFPGERFFEGTRALFTAENVEKPVLNAYRMLARLGDERLGVEASHAWPLDRLDGGEPGMPEEVVALATEGEGGRIAVLVWRHADDQYLPDDGAAEVELSIWNLPAGVAAVRVEHRRIDGAHSNSHAAWEAVGAPQDPTAEQLRAIRERQGLEELEPPRTEPVRDGALTLTLRLPLPSVSLLELTPAAPRAADDAGDV